ncbi:cellulase family glycosylhydrolase [Alteromonas pelagimontana]|uniref:Cellulase family glycosylhydrolase n=1 Tax=Alteromonas pelagimontana TaxID=1858656 RepID=A0A6M4MDV1_9ALTE|nr:carbohydrate-binding protein [Alteromonas pelagimontana]QJR81364.1 cellulase family glycosylhydrolase [Alteromonas pelagimontana]
MKIKTNITTIKNGKLSQLLLASCLAVTITGCSLDEDSDADKHNGETVYDFAPPTPKAGEEQYSLLHQDKEHWVNAEGEVVSLRGVNLGNWLMMEMWMLDNSDNPVGEGIVDQCTLEATLTERFGEAEKERLLDVYRDNYITDRDWDIMADAGFNLIRVPFPYDMLEDENNPMTLREDAWHYLDYAVEQASARNMWVVLDLHGAAGRQGWEHHSGCAGLNQYWDGDEVEANQERTRWLWQQIADHYQGNPAIAGYGVLNEPWGTDAETLAANVKTLYDAIREVDQEHIVILPGHNSGIDAYGDPQDNGMQNVAFEMHFYPGIFGWGEIGYNVHRDWLTCGQTGTTGVCEWRDRINALNTPFLIGEMQPWTGLGELGGPVTRATFDTYNELGWAVTAWSYKVLTTNGGQGNGTWGYVTNKGERLLAKASTWTCDGWNTTLDNACETPATIVTPTDEDAAYYLIVKTGTLDEGLEVTFDNLALTALDSEENILANGGFDTPGDWIEWSATSSSPEDDSLNVEVGVAVEEENILRISAPAGGLANGGVYQKVELTGGTSYRLSGTFTDINSTNAWAEIYLLPAPPINGEEVSAAAMAQIDLNTASKEEIEAYFSSMGTVDYEVNEWVKSALTSAEDADIFQFPSAPEQLSIDVTDEGVSLVWLPVDDATYNVYRTTSSGTDYMLLTKDLDAEMYLDSTTAEGVTYYYVVSADNGEESYFSNEVATEVFLAEIPGRIEAEHFSAQTGFQVEDTLDEGGGQNVGYTDAGDTLTYNVDVKQEGEYVVSFRVSSSGGTEGFAVLLGGVQIATVAVADTGDWQNWKTITATMTLAAGENTLTLKAIGGAWNFNWMEFAAN